MYRRWYGELNMIVKYWWDDTNKRNAEILGEKRVLLLLSRHKSLMDWRGIESGSAEGLATA